MQGSGNGAGNSAVRERARTVGQLCSARKSKDCRATLQCEEEQGLGIDMMRQPTPAHAMVEPRYPAIVRGLVAIS